MKKRPMGERVKAEALFVEQGKGLRQIAEELGADRTTIGLWSVEGNWAAKRRLREFMIPHPDLDALKRELALQIAKVGGDECAEPAAIDALHKLSQIVERMESRLEPEVGPMLDTIGRFARFVASHADDEACDLLRVWVEKFLDDECRRNS